MIIVIRLIIALLAAVGGFVLGFGAVVLVIAGLRVDPGIGGGLIALLAGLIGGIVAAVWSFSHLRLTEKT